MQLSKLPSVYSGNQLMTCSGLDMPTNYANMLTLLSDEKRFTYRFVLPFTGGTVTLPDTDKTVVIGNDFADFGPNRIILADSYNVLIAGEAITEGLDPQHYVELHAPGRVLIGVKGFERPDLLTADFDTLRNQKTAAFADLNNAGLDGLDAKANEAVVRAWEVLRACIYSPEERFTGYWATPDRWPHRACWIMDSVYQALGMRYFRQDVAQDMVCSLFAHQCEDGRVPMTASPEGSIRAQTQQPIIAIGVKATGIHGERLRAVYPKLTKYLEWIFQHRDLDGDGLLEWLMGGGYPKCPCGESGMDNSPRFDGRNPVASVDMNSFVSLECEVMAEFADELGLEQDKLYWTAHHNRLNRLIEENLWNPTLGIYCDLDIHENFLVDVNAVSGFLPLICGAASAERAACMVKQINDPNAYGTKYPLPSVSLSDPKFQLDMWRGPVWHIFNYHVVEGLDRYGYHREADHIRHMTVEAAIRYYTEFGGFFEFYDPNGIVPPGKIDRKGANDNEIDCYHHAVHDYGWSAAMFIDMLFKMNK